MPKRMWVFVVFVLLIVFFTLFSPHVAREEQESGFLNSVPNSSPFGYRALYTLFQQVYSAQRLSFWQSSLVRFPLNKPKVVWFIEPGPGMMIPGNGFKQHIRSMVNNGYHLIFLLNQNPLNDEFTDTKKSMHDKDKELSLFTFLKSWFGFTIHSSQAQALNETFDDPNTAINWENDQQVIRYDINTPGLLTRPLSSLGLRNPPKGVSSESRTSTGTEYIHQNPYALAFFDQFPNACKPLVTVKLLHNTPIAITCLYGRGSVTLMLNNTFFQNYQLARYDNAALAVALQEQFPDSLPIVFEGYSNGFRDNPDVLTYLAKGTGRWFLLASLLLITMFCIGLVTQPTRYHALLASSTDERFFTQEVFMTTLAQHYITTQQWGALYHYLLDLLSVDIQRVASVNSTQQLFSWLSTHPYYHIPVEELQRLFEPNRTLTQDQFIEYAERLLAIHRRICGHESNHIGIVTPSRIRA